jgi:REP element-mobilizing transposase RayT
MPRQSRIDAPGALHHVIARGIERRRIFHDDLDMENFIVRLGKALLISQTSCFAWALLPNHFHLLLRTGTRPISSVMSSLLTGHVMAFNRRHQRSGTLFQNRYKSILCQEEGYLRELLRYIHLNPIRANVIPDLKALDTYPFTGHAVIMGSMTAGWQNIDHVLMLFADQRSLARHGYRQFVEKGLNAGRRPELTGGGLVRSCGGWSAVKSMGKERAHLKSDERILGDSDFVEQVLRRANESMERRHALKSVDFSLDQLAARVGELLSIAPEEIFKPGKQPLKVRARSLFCYWGVHELGHTMTSLAKQLNQSQPSVSISVRRGEAVAKAMGCSLLK